MKEWNKWAIAIVLFAALIFVTLYFLLLEWSPRGDWIGRAYWKYAIHQANRSQIRLLCETDHEALLEGGREILSRVPKPKGPADMYITRIPEGVAIPKVIRKLGPRGIVVRTVGQTTCLVLEMHGGMVHFGVSIYADDGSKPTGPHQFADRELLPGLWYYDDGYLDNPGRDKQVDALIEEHKKK